MNRSAVEVVGGYPLERGFGADASVLCGDANFVRLCPWPTVEQVSLGLLAVRPGTAAGTVRRLNGAPAARRRGALARRAPRARDRPLGQPDLDRQDLRFRRVRGDDRGRRRRLPGPLQRHPRATWRNTRRSRPWATPTATCRRVVLAQGLMYSLMAYPPRRRHRIRALPGDPGPGRHPDAAHGHEPRALLVARGRRQPVRRPADGQQGPLGQPGRPVLKELRSPHPEHGTRAMFRRSTVPLAWRNLTENQVRLLASVAGTAFAVTLMFMETRLPQCAAGQHGRG